MRILLIDDKLIAAKGLQADIKRAEPTFQVTIETSVEKALETVRGALAGNALFDVLLIDRYLGDTDGIDLMQQLRRLSPSSDAIIFTGVGDQAEGHRAISAGACDYFPKPLDDKRLFAQLRRLERERGTSEARNWLETLAEVSKELQGGTTVKEIGAIIVEAAPRLGFERARLWLLKPETQELAGLCQKGNKGLEKFGEVHIPLSDMPYSLEALKRGEPVVFKGDEFGRSILEDRLGGRGFRVAVGERVKVPLLVGKKWIGALTLDNAERPQTYTSEQCKLLRFFGNEAASALERAQHQEDALRNAATQKLLNDISLAVTEQAAKGDLRTLLDVLRRQIYEHLQLGTSGFAVALLDESEPTSHYLDCCYEHRNGQTQPGHHWCDYADDPAKEWIARLIRDGRPGEGQTGRQIGIPLKVQEDVIGVMLIDGRQAITSLGETIREQLMSIAAHVAGLIQAVYREERAKEQRQRGSLRERLIEELRQLARTDENHFWHALLTFATHREGYSFNRAVLFRYSTEEHTLQGRMGIGHFSLPSWQRDVATDAAAGERRSFAAYLALSSVGHLHVTPLATAVLNWRRQLSNDQQDPLRLVCERGERQVLAAADLKQWLPVSEFIPVTMRPSAHCALIPWKDSSEVLGILLVDNAMDDKPVQLEDLAALQDLLAEASQILNEAGESIRLQRQGESYERILRFSWLLTTQSADLGLKERLTQLCQEACDIVKADFVVIYPLGRDGVNYDTKAIAMAGDLRAPRYLVEYPPRPEGTAAYVLRQGTLAVSHVMNSTLEFEGFPLGQQKYVSREGIAAFIGVPIRMAASARPLGVLYLDFRRPQAFSASDILQAEHLASVAGTVIGSAYRIEQEAERFTRESALLQAIQEESLAEDTNEKKVISVVLRTAQELFDRKADTILMLRQWDTDEKQETVRERFRYRRWNPLTYYEDVIPSGAVEELMRRAFEKGAAVSEGDTLAVPIKSSYRTMGCISVANNQEVSAERLERLANATALALDNIRREVRLRAALKAVQQVVEPTELRQTLKAVITAAKDASHGLECVTLWYRDPVSKKHVLGAHWGLLAGSQDAQDPGGSATQAQHEIVRRVMESRSPIWIEDADAEGTLLEQESSRTSFIERQRILSVAAFPLWVKSECIGALFFNYRRRHRFSPGERHALTILAATAAASIHDAQLLEQLDVARAISQAVGTKLDLDEVLLEVLAALQKHFAEPDVSVQPYVMLYDESEDFLYLPAVAKAFAPVDDPRYMDQLNLHLDGRDKGIVCRVARKARQMKDIYVENIIDARADPDFLPFNSKTASLLCAGLTSSGRLWGVLAVSSSKRGVFDEQDKLLLRLAAQQALIAMERSEQAAKLRFKDAVSGVTIWAGELAHDINREIGMIRNRAYWLRNEPGLSDQGRQWVQDIDDGAALLVDVTRGVRTDQRMDLQRFDLCQMLSRRIDDLMRERWPKIKVVTEFHAPEAWLYSYSERLWRGVRHLVRNAADAMKGDGVLTIRTKEHGDKIEIQIEDTGPGVPAELRTVLFEQPYTSKGELREHGYGLLIARQLIESLGGQVRLSPAQPARGALFALTLPLTPERVS